MIGRKCCAFQLRIFNDKLPIRGQTFTVRDRDGFIIIDPFFKRANVQGFVCIATYEIKDTCRFTLFLKNFQRYAVACYRFIDVVVGFRGKLNKITTLKKG